MHEFILSSDILKFWRINNGRFSMDNIKKEFQEIKSNINLSGLVYSQLQSANFS